MFQSILHPAKVAVLALGLLVASAQTSEAQVRVFVGGGGGGYHGGTRWGVSIGSPYYQGGYYRGGYGYGLPYGSNYGYAPYYASPSYYYASPSYYYTAPATVYAPPVTRYQSYYPPVAYQPDNTAIIEVVVPAGAQLWIDGNSTAQTGTVRYFTTPPLTPGQTFTYDVRATWTDSSAGPVTQQRTVQVQAGQQSAVNFMAE